MLLRMMTSLVAMAMVAMIVTGCERGEEPPAPEPGSPPTIDQEELAQMERVDPPRLEEAVAMAMTDLAGRLGVTETDIGITEAREVTWRDGALGCPDPEMMYTQALVNGYLIELEAGGETHAYHAGSDGVPFPCPAQRRQAPIERSEAPRE